MLTKTPQLARFSKTRNQTEKICAPLAIEDYVVQPVEFVSPPKWHLGHTTWFFEEFVLSRHQPDYQRFNEQFAYVFNSYYESVGAKVVRTNRGNLSRPSVEEIYAYRAYVTEAMEVFLENDLTKEITSVIEIGIQHEQQHQELLLTDIKYILGNNPLLPPYGETIQEDFFPKKEQQWISLPEGVYEIGLSKDYPNFCYDNEQAKHKTYLQNYFIASELVTNGEFMDFMEDGGYEQVLLWHAEAWDWLKTNAITCPQYWHQLDGEWHRYSLQGLQKVDRNAVLTHVSYYEAFAFAQWKNLRLPTEFEWEAAQEKFDWGQRWEWTESAYLPYPGYRKAAGALGEYNGKFMVNQKVLRGASLATANKHSRATYRNFFHPHLRWQFTGIRLAK